MSFFPSGSRLRTISLRSLTRPGVRTYGVTSQVTEVWNGPAWKSQMARGLLRAPLPTWKSAVDRVEPASGDAVKWILTDLTVCVVGMSPKSMARNCPDPTSSPLPSRVLTESSLPLIASVPPSLESYASVAKIVNGWSITTTGEVGPYVTSRYTWFTSSATPMKSWLAMTILRSFSSLARRATGVTSQVSVDAPSGT